MHKIFILVILTIFSIGCRTAITPVRITNPSANVATVDEGAKIIVLKTNQTKLTPEQKAIMRDRILRKNTTLTDVDFVSGPEYRCASNWDMDRGCNKDSEVVTCTCPAEKVDGP